jgi:hypothetical protein
MSGNTIKKVQKEQLKLLEAIDDSTCDNLRSLHTPELVIALCGPIGSPLHDVSNNISELLTTKFGYLKCETIRLSGFIEKFAALRKEDIPEKALERALKLIALGNSIREEFGTDILAKLAIKKIAESRNHADTGDSNTVSDPKSTLKEATKAIRIAHIIDSIKNQSELDMLSTNT